MRTNYELRITNYELRITNDYLYRKSRNDQLIIEIPHSRYILHNTLLNLPFLFYPHSRSFGDPADRRTFETECFADAVIQNRS